MASRPSPDKLIHCDACGEDYSATYRRCPFCGERNDPRRAFRDSPPPAPPAQDEDDQDDGYIFDGQDAFDDEQDNEEYYAPRPKAGKRLAPKQGGRGVDLPPINWPRLITFLCSLVIIVAALIIVFTVIYPQLHGKKPPNPDNSQPPASMEPSADPSNIVTLPTAPVEPTDEPSMEPTDPPVQPTLTGMTLYGSDGRRAEDFTLWVGDSYQLEARFTPSDWSGTVTWTSSNPDWLSVSSTGLVANVNSSGAYHNAYVTATADGVSVQCVVRVQARRQNEQPVQSNPPAVSDPPAATTTPPPSGGTVTVGRTGTIVNAELGLRVRSGPGTTYQVIASLVNGNTVNVLANAGGGWYQVSFAGSGGTTITGYIMGDYISTR